MDVSNIQLTQVLDFIMIQNSFINITRLTDI